MEDEDDFNFGGGQPNDYSGGGYNHDMMMSSGDLQSTGTSANVPETQPAFAGPSEPNTQPSSTTPHTFDFEALYNAATNNNNNYNNNNGTYNAAGGHDDNGHNEGGGGGRSFQAMLTLSSDRLPRTVLPQGIGPGSIKAALRTYVDGARGKGRAALAAVNAASAAAGLGGGGEDPIAGGTSSSSAADGGSLVASPLPDGTTDANANGSGSPGALANALMALATPTAMSAAAPSLGAYCWRPQRKGRQLWSDDDTRKFFDGLQQYGADFSLISVLFPGKRREDIKKKYQQELKARPRLVEEALHSKAQMPVDLDQLDEGLRLWSEHGKAPVAPLTAEDEQLLQEFVASSPNAPFALSSHQQSDGGNHINGHVDDDGFGFGPTTSGGNTNNADDFDFGTSGKAQEEDNEEDTTLADYFGASGHGGAEREFDAWATDDNVTAVGIHPQNGVTAENYVNPLASTNKAPKAKKAPNSAKPSAATKRQREEAAAEAAAAARNRIAEAGNDFGFL